jgi:MacB-like periplasmic core domain
MPIRAAASTGNLEITDLSRVDPLKPVVTVRLGATYRNKGAHLTESGPGRTLRSLPGVIDAYADYSYPIAGPWANLTGLKLEREQKSPTSLAEPYFADEHALATYGLRLIKGRNFQANDVVLGSTDENPKVGSIIITESLSQRLFPAGDALGKTVFMGNHPRTIVGIIADVKVPEKKAPANLAYKAVFLPVRLADVAAIPTLCVRNQALPNTSGRL